MKLAFDAKRYFVNQTGLGNYSRWLIDALGKEKGLDIQLYHPGQERIEGLNVYGPTKPFHQRFSSIWRSVWMYKDLVKNGVEVYHGLSNELPYGIHHTAIKTVVTIHDLIQKRYPENYKNIDRRIYNKKIDYAQKFADVIVVPSVQTKKDLIKYFATDPEKIKVIPLGLNPLPNFPKEAFIDGPYILCVSGLSRRKNLVRLVKAYQRSALYGKVKLVIAGKKGDAYLRLNNLCKSDEHIVLLSDLPTKALHQLYNHALFCVYPSLFEGFGIPVMEAFQHGKVVAASSTSSLKEVGGDAAVYFDPEQVGSIGKTLESLYFSEKQRQHLESLIPQRLKHFDTPRILKEYLKIYSQVAQG